jgi:hypothetical protein
LYFIVVCMLPVFIAMLLLEVRELREVPFVVDWAPTLAMVSPLSVVMFLFHEMGSRFPSDPFTAPFYAVHVALLGLVLVEMRRRGRKLREMYLTGLEQETER